MRALMDFQRRAGTNVMTPPLTSTITASEIQQLCQNLKQSFQSTIKAIENEEENTGAASSSSSSSLLFQLSRALGEASEISAVITLPSMTHNDADVRQASTKGKDMLKSMFDETFARPKLYQALLKQQQESNTSENYFQSLLLTTFRRNGCDIAEAEKRQTLLSKRKLIEETCSAFCSSINENTDCLLFTDKQLDGVSNLDQFPLDENTKKRKIALKAPFTVPCLQFANLAETRKAVAVALASKCQDENTNRFLDVLKLRQQAAQIMGYKSHAHYMLETKMASKPEIVEQFLVDLITKLKPQRDKDLQILLDLKKQDANTDAADTTTLNPWDISYYIRLHKATLGVDVAKLQEYFPLEHVKQEILEIYQELLHLKFLRVKDAEVWHEDVECYAVLSADNNNNSSNNNSEPLGYFYFDIYPRDGKYSHQCVYPLRPSYTNFESGERIKPACANLGNLSRGTEGKPSMLRFSEVETFFHEFGHVMHCVLAKSEHSLQAWAWTAVPWPGGVEQDFLEVPSMMLENFVWQFEILKRLSKRPSDNASLPAEMIDALCKSRTVMEGYANSRYLAMALYDLKVHSGPGPYQYKEKSYDAIELYSVMMKDIGGVSTIPNTFSVASWFHLMMGYDAGYYSYIWSEALAADLFSEFEKTQEAGGSGSSSIINPVLGKKYRETILSPCAMIDGESMLQNFLGRKASNDAFLKRILDN